jgi:hypothetical protein
MSLQHELEAVASDKRAMIGEHVGESDDCGHRDGRHERAGEAHVMPSCSSAMRTSRRNWSHAILLGDDKHAMDPACWPSWSGDSTELRGPRKVWRVREVVRWSGSSAHSGNGQEHHRSDEQGPWCGRPPERRVPIEATPRQEEAHRQDHPDHDPEAGKLSELPDRGCEAVPDEPDDATDRSPAAVYSSRANASHQTR